MEDLKELQKDVRKLASSLTVPAKAKTDLLERKKWLEKVRNLFENIDLLQIKQKIDSHYVNVNSQIDTQLKARRENFLKISRENQFIIERIDSYDKFDVLKVEYKGNMVIISINNVKLLQKELANGEEIFEACKAELEKLRNFPFDRRQFLSQLKLAISFLKLANPKAVSQSGSVILKEVYPLIRFVREYQGQRKGTYELCQFIYDLARFVEGGVTEESLRVEMETPSKAFTREALILPNLANPTSPGKPVRKIRLVSSQEKRQ